MDPRTAVGKSRAIMGEMFGSHDWQVEEGKPYGVRGVIVRFRCSRCNAIGHAICESQ